MRWRKIRAVATFEFLYEVRRWPYIIFTFGMPLFLLAYGGFITLFVKAVERSGRERIYGVVDAPGVLGLTGDLVRPSHDVPAPLRGAMERAQAHQPLLSEVAWFGNFVFRPFAEEAQAVTELRSNAIIGYFRIPADYMQTGRVDSVVGEKRTTNLSDARRTLRSLLLNRLIDAGVPPELASRIQKPLVEGQSLVLKSDGTLAPYSVMAKVAHLAIPIGMTVLLFVAIMGGGQTLIQGMASEKENRVVEVLLSSANPEEILAGKLLGLGATGLLQITVWFGMAGVAALLFAATLTAMGVEIQWVPIFLAVPFFVAGYLFLGSLMLGTGSFGNNVKEGQQWAIVWTLLSAVPMIALGILMQEPNGTVAKVLTWFPFSAPSIVIFRLTMEGGGIRWWEIAGSFLVLVACTWVALKLGARLFRVGLLMTGSRPKLREILRQARLNA